MIYVTLNKIYGSLNMNGESENTHVHYNQNQNTSLPNLPAIYDVLFHKFFSFLSYEILEVFIKPKSPRYKRSEPKSQFFVYLALLLFILFLALFANIYVFLSCMNMEVTYSLEG